MSRVLGSLGSTLARLGTIIGTAVLIGPQVLFDVEAGHRALIFDRFSGVTNTVYAEGTHFKVPLIQYPVILDVRKTPRIITSITGTKDLQQVSLALRVISHPRVEKLPEIYKTLNLDYNERVLPSVGNEVLKAVVAQYNADQLLTQRDQVSKEIKAQMMQRCEKFNIVLDDVAITHLEYSREFTRAIEDKQVTEQRAERAKFIVQRNEQEKLALIIRSEGDAEAAQLVSDALQKAGNGLIELRRIETAQRIADVLAGNNKVTYLPSAGKQGGAGGAGQTGTGSNIFLGIR